MTRLPYRFSMQAALLLASLSAFGPAARAAGFQTAAIVPTGSHPRWVVIEDFNGDGNLDMAVPNSFSNNVTVLLGNGDGTFQSPLTFSAGQGPTFIGAADFNLDGKLDLAVSNGAGNNVSILIGNGDGTFGSPKDFPCGTNPQSLAI